MAWSEDYFEREQLEADADDLGDAIIKQYGKFNVNIDITHKKVQGDRFVYTIKTKKNTRKEHIRAHAPDVQLRLRLPQFYVQEHNLALYIIASRMGIEYDHLLTIFKSSAYKKARTQYTLPHVIGHNVVGNIVMDDLAQYPHLLLGGSTRSGKSVGLQALITSIAYSRSPSQVNLILIDVGASDLMPFEGLPHLSCPVVRDPITAIHTLAALNDELERRAKLEYADPISFEKLPKLVLVIDEFPALFGSIEKAESKSLQDTISNLLNRGSHARIHVVLAAQNPTIPNMKVELGNITVRIAFKCAKKNYSETILGEGGAEKLRGRGDLLLNSHRVDGLQRIQGIYITPEELFQVVQHIKARPYEDTNKFTIDISNSDLAESSGTLGSQLSCRVAKKSLPRKDQLLADAIMWALGKEEISINRVKDYAHIHWNKATEVVKRMEELRIVDKPETPKSPRKVIPDCFEDLPKELVNFLCTAGYDKNRIIDVLPTAMRPKETEDELGDMEDQSVPLSNVPSNTETEQVQIPEAPDEISGGQRHHDELPDKVHPEISPEQMQYAFSKYIKKHPSPFKVPRKETAEKSV